MHATAPLHLDLRLLVVIGDHPSPNGFALPLPSAVTDKFTLDSIGTVLDTPCLKVGMPA